jgi:hypothetical protein
MKKNLILAIIVVVTFLGSAVGALAAPWVHADKYSINDKYVSYDEGGLHGIAGIDGLVLGRDLVMKRGNQNQFHQWLEGLMNEIYVAVHSVWNLSNDGKCPKDWVVVADAYPNWGSYMEEGATYCVHNNFYQGTK